MRARILFGVLFLVFHAPSIYAADFTIDSTADFDGGIKTNVVTETDEYAVGSGEITLSFPYADKDPDLVSYWRCENNGSDEKGTNPIVALHGDATYTTGIFDDGCDYGGISGYAEVTNDASLNFGSGGDFSVSMWIKADSVTGYHILISKRNLAASGNRPGWLVLLDGDEILMDTFEDGGSSWNKVTTITANVATGICYHIVVTRSGGSASIFLNGADLTADGTVNSGSLDNIYNLHIATEIYSTMPGGIFWFDGIIDEVRIYSKELDSTEIGTLYNSGNQYKSSGNWTSATQTMPTGEAMEQTTIYHSGLTGSNYIDMVEWLVGDATNAVYDPVPGITNGASTCITRGMITSGSFSAVHEDFQIKLYLVGDGSSTPTVAKIEGETMPPPRTVFQIR